jgi:hypothetical protein
LADLLDTPALETPVRFDEGFSFTSSFSVAIATNYQIEVAFRRTSPHEPVEEAFHELPIKFTITCEGTNVAQGDSPGFLGGSGSEMEDTRTLAYFKAEPGKNYDLSFHVVRALPSVAATKPVVRVHVPLYIQKGPMIGAVLETYLAGGLTVGGLLFAIPVCVFFVRRRMGRGSRKLC